jgi:FdhE protein
MSKKESVLKNDSISSEMLMFYGKLFEMQEKFSNNPEFLGSAFFKVDNRNLPALKAGYVSFNDSLVKELMILLEDITGLIREENNGLDFSKLLEEFSGFVEDVFAELLNKDYEALGKRASSCNLDFEEFLFVIHNLFKPLVVSIREISGFEPESDDEWFEGNCPFCGYLPSMSKIVGAKDNQRIMGCALCEHEWKYLRVTCFVCGNNEQKKQGYFESEVNSLYRAYYCEECKSYIKTLNVAKSQEESGLDLYVEDILTTSLDASMLGKGYTRP